MSVATKNPFALLDDDAPEVAPVVEKKEAPAPPPSRGTQKTRGGPASRGGKYYARGGRPQASKDSPAAEDPAPEGQKKFDGNREGGRGRGRGRGRGGDRPSRGRPFDRHSQTGKTDSDKKIHQSWGGDDGNTELKAEQAASTDAAAEWGAPAATDADAWGSGAAASADAWATPAEGENAEAEAKPEGRPRREREPEEEDNTLTLDQYLAQQKEKESAIPKLDNTRKANEGAEDDLWKGATKSAPKSRTEKKEKVFLEIDARFERPDRGGRGRGRGGDRGGDRARGAGRGRGRGGRQNGSSAAPVVNVDDQTAFPSLS
ncbi:hypothetical protein CVT24_011583 [Panaeolus cyanescens]|uniref:Hyaluronan/mRNA-binding protein domain-containing protein n=1 Tax=Panaeolus cyanescens TaxID=181874 RepID=A0A409YV92_9AGAR|nr:hypothetical protein CVT24_011583 [Panaeolus cyanescens]